MLFASAFLLFAASVWTVFEKAGQPGWGAFIPVYNLYLLTQIAGRSGNWVLFFFVPILNVVTMFILQIDIARRFGKEDSFGVGMALLPFVFYPMLAFGDAQYDGNEPQEEPTSKSNTFINEDGEQIETIPVDKW
ncbi:MAG: signal peptidase I [Bacteroidetes bacterium]|nr:MAG: signal peptidase I [Bacteroidota bacterium]